MAWNHISQSIYRGTAHSDAYAPPSEMSRSPSRWNQMFWRILKKHLTIAEASFDLNVRDTDRLLNEQEQCAALCRKRSLFRTSY